MNAKNQFRWQWEADNASLREENAALRAELLDLVTALWKLANEATGFLSMANRESHGTTNMRVLQMRIDEARAVIAKAEATK
jgi:hypothetical protein